MKLSKKEKEEIIRRIENDDYLDDKLKDKLFKGKKECELIYEGKEREVDILSDTMAVPLQEIKTFKNGNGKHDWTNMLIFGDNLQVLKELLNRKEEGLLKNADGSDGVRLIYIDPPFSTKQDFKGSQDQKAYQDKIAGAKFLEFIRKRLIFLRELLCDDGSIYVHLDYRKGHYIKILLDEIFSESSFKNEIIWQKTLSRKAQSNNFGNIHDIIYFYSKNNIFIFNQIFEKRDLKTTVKRFPLVDKKTGKRYVLDNFTQEGQGEARYFGEKGLMKPPSGKHWIWSQEKINDGLRNNIIQFTRNNMPRLVRFETEGIFAGDIWTEKEMIMHSQSNEDSGYPTQKPEKLIERIINASSNKGDLILDCFIGSGTTLAVAEKLGRRWIGVDCGKLAIYTTQKRMLTISKSKNLENDKKNYGKECKPFTLYNAGLYDYKMIKELPWEEYRDFALKLFQCRDEKHTRYKIDFDGFLGSDSVIVFNYQIHKDAVMDRGYIDDLHKYLGDRIGSKLYIIAPAASVKFLEDYIEKGKTRYYILRIPYSIIEEIHKRDFKKLSQPMSEADVNDTIDSVGFDFMQTPKVECEYSIKKPKKSELFNEKTKECVIKIKKFISNTLSKKPLEIKNLESLSMVMLDYDFDGNVFDVDDVFYADEIATNDYEIRFDSEKIDKQMMIIYLDIFGNEKREIKTLKEFKR